MSVLAARKCERHPAREAVARCPACDDHFCRECVVEHDGRLLCAACLAKQSVTTKSADRARWRRAGRAARLGAAVLLLWVVFYGFGQFLKTIPTQVHEGTVWRPGD